VPQRPEQATKQPAEHSSAPAPGRPTQDPRRDVGSQLAEAVRVALAAAADPVRAPGQQAYMKSEMPFRGLRAPQVSATLRPILADPAYRLGTRQEWEGTVRALWDGAAFREERYAALALTGHRLYRGFQDPEAVPLYRHLVLTGAWWDYIDQIAAQRIGPILRAFPDTESVRMRAWARDDSLWLRRTAILSQLGSHAATDLPLLLDCIEPSVDSREFFLAKAIGWALRQYAHEGPAAADRVREVVRSYGDRMAPLSRREALKHLG
jgi:3-methyladenine DNA glycosylase AlkD